MHFLKYWPLLLPGKPEYSEKTLDMLLNSITKDRGSLRYFALLMVCLALLFALFIDPALAQKKRQNLPLIRDAEIEGLLKTYSAPIFKAAGMPRGSVDIFIINRRDFNAFVTGTRMFFFTGALTTAKTPNEIIGVMAHETGHLVGHHSVRLHEQMAKAKIMSVLGAIAGAGAMLAGGEGGAAAGSAILMGSQQAIQRGILSYQRSEEIAADRTAINLLNKSGQSSFGMLKIFKGFARNELFSTGSQNSYGRSHPLPRERIALLQDLAAKSKHANKKDSPALQLRHDMMRAKVAAYTGGARAVRSLFSKNLHGAPARYGDAITTYLSGAPRRAIPKINALIKQQPKNPYLYEMKGEMLLHSGKAAAAIKPFKRAIKLDRYKSGLLRIQLGHAYLETNNSKYLGAAIKELKAGISRDRNSADGYGHLARAYARQGKTIYAIAASAEEKYMQGNFKQAKIFAHRAQPKLKRGTPQWLRLQDILDYKPLKKRR